MSTEDNKTKTALVQEGYQGARPEHRGYQGTADKGYQPSAQVSTPQPPPVGTTTVVAVKSPTAPTTNSTQSGTDAKS